MVIMNNITAHNEKRFHFAENVHILNFAVAEERRRKDENNNF